MLGTRQKAKTLAEPQPRRWTRKEYYRLLDLDFFRNQRVELIEGEILEMPSMKNPHAIALGLAQDVLGAVFGPGYWVRNQLPLHFGSRSEPEPDFAVVQGGPRDYQDHPTTALLVVEISDTTLSFDRGRKKSLYARAGIEDYWIVNLMDDQLEVYREPQLESRRPRRYTYSKVTMLKPGAVAKPLAAPNARIAVSNLLP
jgi:Uma2 family endonuclease